ncbi:hypothetical protein RHS01_11318 [Rhizoctonia solani]|uniref:Retrotransposable element Tf2 155 kDa protein type 1 n=1 Tax=Rhizoctonia solani TaxID=456999 RepID=A0A8H7I047_9AGAM|nr:hypothetical protein RHS01_11318 [Rhizoctonia solani]
MATRSRSSACPPSPLDQGELGPALPATANEPRSLEPEVYGEIPLSRAISLLLGLQNQVIRLEQELEELREVNKETRDWMGAVDQTLTRIEASGGPQPHTPEDRKPRQSRPRPGPYPKPTLFQRLVRPLLPGPTPLNPPSPSPNQLPSEPPETAPVVAYQAPVKVDHPDAYTGKIGNESRQWLTRMMAWVRLNQRMFPTDQEVLSFLLMNMKDTAGAWAHPHLDQLGSHRAIIQTVEDFRREFLAAFGNPDATRAAERQITNLTQTGTCAEYITKFRTIAMDLDWNDAALCGQFARGLHWELQNAALVIDNALREERASHPPKGNKSGTSNTTPTGGRVPANRPQDQVASPAILTLSPRRSKTAAGLKASASNAGKQGTSLRNAALAGRPCLRRKALRVPAAARKDPKDSGITSPSRTVTMLDGSSPQAGKIWKKANLTFSFDGKHMTETFLICNTGLIGICAPSPFPTHHQNRLPLPRKKKLTKNPLEGVPSKYHQYAKVFGEEEFNKLPPHRHYDIGIELTEEGPLNSPLYSMTDAESATLKDWLRDKLKAGKIRPSKSSISSPVMFVPKKDGSRRLVVDYRRLNNRTKKNVYPLPRPDDLMAQLCGAKVFTKLDLRWGYNNVQVKEGDEWKTAFRTKYGLYKSLVMTFGLTNAPAAFQHFMNELFKDLLDVCVIIYLDDILIYSKDDASHTQHVHEVLRRLLENQLFCKASKCLFHVTSVEYLGIIVSDKGFSLDKLKIQAVQEWPTPTKVKEVQSFLGFANFLRRFVANFSHMARPLHNLVKKDTPWKWDTKEQEAFQGLKNAITNAPVLCHADPSKPYFLETDASGAALGSILSQRQEDGRLHPLGFLSESFKGAEQNYNTTTKNCWQLSGPLSTGAYSWKAPRIPSPFLPITAIWSTGKNPAPSTTPRTWHLLLAGYNFQIVYRPGKTVRETRCIVTRADHADTPPKPQSMLPEPVFANLALITPEKELQRQIEQSLDQDKPWQHVSYDMIVDLPKDGNHDSILVIVDSFTKYGIFVKCSKKLRAPELAELFLEHVWKRHGMPEKTISDRGRVFNNKFLRALYKRLGIDPHFSSAYHPQSDGQTERVNPLHEHFLRAYSGINQRDWTKWLPMAEFAYNNAVHSSTEADSLAQTMEAQWKEIESALRQSKQRMVAGEDGNPTEFEVGEEAWLNAKNVTLKTLSPKLTEQRLGPFKVIEKISNRAYRLNSPYHEDPQRLLCRTPV